MGVTIRPATAGDLPAVRAIARAAYAPYVERLGFEPPPMVQDFEAALDDLWVLGEPVAGYVVFHERRHEDGADVYLHNVAVDPVHHGAGHGRRLVAFVEDAARRAGLPVLLHTNEVMTENLAIYPRLGYVEVDRRVEDGLRRVFFRKDVS